MYPDRRHYLTYSKERPRAFFGILFFIALSISSAYAQDHLFLEKPPFKRKRVVPGDLVRIKLVGGGPSSSLTYQAAQGDSIHFANRTIHLDAISKIWVRRPVSARHWLKSLSIAGFNMLIAFPALMMLDVINSGNRFRRSDWVRIRFSMATGFSTALAANCLIWRGYRIGKNWNLNITPPIEKMILPQ